MRVLLAPIEIAGQMAITARALRAIGVNAISCNYRYKKNPYGHSCDLDLGPNGKSPKVVRKISQFNFILTSLFRFDVFHFNFGKTLLKHSHDLPLLKRLGKKLVLEFWGSDARMDDAEERAVPEKLARKKREKILHRMRKFGQYIDVALVADLELKGYVEPFFRKVELVPQRVELNVYEPHYPDPAEKRPLIVHAPTHRELKGTQYLLDAVEKLKRKYSFEFSLIEGMKHSEAREQYRNADLIVDQLRIGTYGVFAVETMALGKPVITYIRDEVRDGYPKNLPVVSASQESITEVLESLLVNGMRRHELGIQSRQYVEEHHDSIRVAKRIHSIYQTI